MRILNKHYSSIWEEETAQNDLLVSVIDQKLLPFKFEIRQYYCYKELVNAIKDMTLRGAPLIGAAGAYSVCLALQAICNSDIANSDFENILSEIKSARPTAVNLEWAVNLVADAVSNVDDFSEKYSCALNTTRKLIDNEIENCRKIGEYGKDILLDLFYKKNGQTLNILTHCNAGWLATIDYGTALAPIYSARDCGVNLHVWVDETRPRNQGARLTAFELLNENIPHTIIADNTGGLLMQNGSVDCVVVGADRIARNGDVCNKIGTYLKALAAADSNIPFFVAAPKSSFDFEIASGKEIPIECRSSDEVEIIEGIDNDGNFTSLRILPNGSKSLNYGFDITPARLITKIITEHSTINANEIEIMGLKNKQ